MHEPPPEVLPRQGEHEIKTLLRKGELEVGALPQGCTNEGDRKPSWPLREPSHEDVLST